MYYTETGNGRVAPLPTELQALWIGALNFNAPGALKLPSPIRALPKQDPRRTHAEKVLVEARDDDEDQIGSIACLELRLLCGDPSLDELLAFIALADSCDNDGHTETDIYLGEVGAAKLEDITPSQRWELSARIGEFVHGVDLVELRAAMERPRKPQPSECDDAAMDGAA